MCVPPLENCFKKDPPNLHFAFQVTFQDHDSGGYFGFCMFMLVVFRIKKFEVHVKASMFSWFRVEFEMRASGRIWIRFMFRALSGDLQSHVWFGPCLGSSL